MTTIHKTMLSNYVGRHIPQVRFPVFTEGSLYHLSTTDLFKDKTIVLFAVSGAFTYPSSSFQLLGYNKYAGVFRTNGVDDILCLSVNDPFSLAMWAQEEQADQVRCLPDVNGDFTRQMRMMVNLSEKGMGQRSWRYSMLVKNEIIDQIFVEPEGFETLPLVSNAETMLDYINPAYTKPQMTATLMQMWKSILSD